MRFIQPQTFANKGCDHLSDNHNTQLDLYQDPRTCQDVKTGDSARLVVAPVRTGSPSGGVRREYHQALPVSPLSNFEAFAQGVKADYGTLVFEADQRAGKRTLVIDRDAVKVTLPPTGNTGVTVTYNPEWYKEERYRTLVDTVEGTFSVKTQDELTRVVEWCTSAFGGGQDIGAGMRGYPCQRICADGVRLLFDPNRLSQGVHIIVGGEAAQRHALRLNDLEALLITFVDAQQYRFKFGRFDVACDAVGLHISAVNDSIKAGELVTRTRKARRLSEFDPSTGDDVSSTIYVGSVRSDRMVRFYDKAAELGISDADITRCEVQYRGGYAQAAGMAWLGGVIDVESLVASAVDFRTVTADTNVSRRPRVSWWADWLGKFARVTLLSVEKPLDSVKRSLSWFKKQVAPTFAFLLRAMPDSDWVASADVWGEFKMSAAKRALLAGLENIDRGARDVALSAEGRLSRLAGVMNHAA